MAPRTFKIELRVDHDLPSEDKDKIVQDAVLMAAKQLKATALLIQDKRAPQIAVQVGDMFVQDEEVDILAEQAENPEPAPEEQAEAQPEAPPEPPIWERFPGWKDAYDAEYTVSGSEFLGFKFNDPDGKWSEEFPTAEAAWSAAAFHHQNRNPGGN